jgi:hypothetical protein
MFAIYPVTLFFTTFLSKEITHRIFTLETIIYILTIHLITFGIFTLAIWLLTFEIIQNITSLLGILNPSPILILVLFELWFIFFYFWDHRFIPYLEKERFSLLVKPIEVKHKGAKSFLLNFKKITNWIFRKQLLYTSFIFYFFILYWCISLHEYFQFIMILIIAIGNSYLIYNHMKKVKKNKKYERN